MPPKPVDPIAAMGGHMERIEGLHDPAASRLCSNESPLGMSRLAQAAATAAIARAHEYPEDEGDDLIAALAARHGIPPGRIRLGGGLDPLMASLVLAFAGPGDDVVYAADGYARYARYAMMAGATGVPVRDQGDLKPDLQAIGDAVGPRTRVVMLANPDNPSGAYQTAAEVAALQRRLPEDVLLVLDGAYADYVAAEDFGDGGLQLSATSRNVIVGRTFSKIHGMAGLRLAWLAGDPALLSAVGKTGSTFPVNAVALAGGLAAVNDLAHTAAARAHNDHWRSWLHARLARHQALDLYPSEANFQLIGFPAPEDARACAAALAAEGLLVRRFTNAAFDRHLRVSIGAGPALERVADVIDAFMRAR